MISDINREWAAWYYFASKFEIDIQVLGNYTPEILGEKLKFPSHFTTYKPMFVDDLCGKNELFGGRPFRYAALSRDKRVVEDDPIDLQLWVQSAAPGTSMKEIGPRPTTHPIHLRFKRIGGDVSDYPLGFGWLNYAGITEKFNFLWPYHSTREKLRALEDMLLQRGGPRIQIPY